MPLGCFEGYFIYLFHFRSKSSVRLHQNGDVSSPPGPCPRRKGEHKPTNTSRDVGNVSPTPSFKLALECPRKIDSPPTSVKRTLSISQNKPSTPVNRSNSNHTNNRFGNQFLHLMYGNLMSYLTIV